MYWLRLFLLWTSKICFFCVSITFQWLYNNPTFEKFVQKHIIDAEIDPYVQSSSFLSSPPDRCGCPPRCRCSVRECRPSADNNQRSRHRSSTRRRRRGRSSAARSARQSARLETSPRQLRAFSSWPGDSPGCCGCLFKKTKQKTNLWI